MTEFVTSIAPDYVFLLYVLQNFLFVSKDEKSPIKAIDFGLSDFVNPGMILLKQNGFFFSLVVFLSLFVHLKKSNDFLWLHKFKLISR